MRKDDLKPLFLSRQKNRFSKKAIQDFAKVTGQRAGTKQVHPHIFRHTIAMHLLEDGYKLEEIQLLLGHENISTTQVYAHGNIQSVQEKIDEFYTK
ncbi:tyrosine-type recombinase/integrase [Wukongibacter sp. M2B1]|uniref:tyrosine-type recombinase/integrase n=1 Tax=Wukongibacter sp. M2B1 TaxID=3088895 RepID=UPI003D7AB0D4